MRRQTVTTMYNNNYQLLNFFDHTLSVHLYGNQQGLQYSFFYGNK